MPKQFLTLKGDYSGLQETAQRFMRSEYQPPIVICSEQYRFLAVDQLSQVGIDSADILLEPVSRNSAAAICSVAWHICNNHGDGKMIVMPSDHIIEDDELLMESVVNASSLADENHLVTIGVKPTRVATQLGHIVCENTARLTHGFNVSRFVEKPSQQAAERLMQQDNCWWNAGMFIFKASTILDSFKTHALSLHEDTRRAVTHSTPDLAFIRLASEPYQACESISIDYAVMEKASNLAMVPFHGQWCDIGTWATLKENLPADESGNVIKGDAIVNRSNGLLIHSTSRLVAANALSDVVIVETPDAVLVSDAKDPSGIPELIQTMKQQGRDELDTSGTSYRPWGHYTNLTIGNRFQVKNICVKPGAKLSLQKHFHRSEHWVVVTGTAMVTIDDKEFQLTENESTYIPQGTIHRLHNPGSIPLEIIEIQTGSYLGEDDIVRYSDDYGRNEDANFH